MKNGFVGVFGLTLWMLSGCVAQAPTGGGDDSPPDSSNMDSGDGMNDGMNDGSDANNDSNQGDGSGAIWMQQDRLEAFDAQGEDLYGDAVAIADDLVAVGTEAKNALAGVVDIFISFAGEWRFNARLEPGPARFPEQSFGSAVAISNQFAFVGAQKFSIEGSFDIQRGAVYVFRNLGIEWQQVQLLTVSDGDDFEYLGNSLAFEPNQGRLVAGAVGRASSQGAVYVFVTNGQTFSQQARLMASDGINFEDFGDAVVTQGLTIAVGASNQNSGTGAVYIYQFDADWVEQQKILAPDGVTTDKFGASLALDGDTLVIGAPTKKRPGDELLQAGAVYVYQRNNGAWNHAQTIVPNDRDAGLFGESVALENGVMVISVSSESEAMILENQNGQWQEVDRISSGNEQFVLDSFGDAIAISEGTIVVGARSADAAGQRAAGAAFIFSRADDSGPNIDDGTRF